MQKVRCHFSFSKAPTANMFLVSLFHRTAWCTFQPFLHSTCSPSIIICIFT